MLHPVLQGELRVVVQVVPVVVGNDHDVDAVRHVGRRVDVAARVGPEVFQRQGRGVAAEDGVDEDVPAVQLQIEGRVAHPDEYVGCRIEGAEVRFDVGQGLFRVEGAVVAEEEVRPQFQGALRFAPATGVSTVTGSSVWNWPSL